MKMNRLSFYASATLVVTTLQPAVGEVEVHHTAFVWEQVGGKGNPMTFSAAPVPMFNDLNGTRRLCLVRIVYDVNWTATIRLDNPLPEQQCVHYTPYEFSATAIPSAGLSIEMEAAAIPGRFGAPALQSATRDLQWIELGLDIVYRRRFDPELVDEHIGVGIVSFQSGRPGGGFDTFLLEDAEPDCSGGFFNGGPFGFSVPLVRWDVAVRYEYHWTSSSCPVDLTTLSIPGSQSYGQPDCIVDSHDFFYYLDQFALGNLAVADLTTNARPALPGYGTPNGVITNDDFFYFLLQYAEGC